MLSTKYDFILLGSLEDETRRQTVHQALHTIKTLFLGDSTGDLVQPCVIICRILPNSIKFKITRVVPKVMSNFFLHANWGQQTKESAVGDGTSYCVILECLVTSIACIT